VKVTITNKGEGYVEARYDAQSPVEAMMLATCLTNVSADTTLELKTDETTDWSTTPPAQKHIAGLSFHGFRIQVHSMLAAK